MGQLEYSLFEGSRNDDLCASKYDVIGMGHGKLSTDLSELFQCLIMFCVPCVVSDVGTDLLQDWIFTCFLLYFHESHGFGCGMMCQEVDVLLCYLHCSCVLACSQLDGVTGYVFGRVFFAFPVSHSEVVGLKPQSPSLNPRWRF